MNCLSARKQNDALIVINPIGPQQAEIDQRLKSIPLMPKEIIYEIFKLMDTKTYFKCSIASKTWKQAEVQFTSACLKLFDKKPNCKLKFKGTKEKFHPMDADEETIASIDQNKIVFWDLKTNRVCRKSYDHHSNCPPKKFFLRNKGVFVVGAACIFERFEKIGTRLSRIDRLNNIMDMTFMHPTNAEENSFILVDLLNFYYISRSSSERSGGFLGLKCRFEGLKALTRPQVDEHRKYVECVSNGELGLLFINGTFFGERVFRQIPSLWGYALSRDYLICRCWDSSSKSARKYKFYDRSDLRYLHSITIKPLESSFLGEFEVAGDKLIEIESDSSNPGEELYIRKIPTCKLLCKPIKIKMGTLRISYPYMAFGLDKTVQIWSLINLTKVAQIDWEVSDYAQIRFSVVPRPYLAIAGKNDIIAWNPIREK